MTWSTQGLQDMSDRPYSVLLIAIYEQQFLQQDSLSLVPILWLSHLSPVSPSPHPAFQYRYNERLGEGGGRGAMIASVFDQ